MKQNIKLLSAIREKDLRQRDFARALGIGESLVSEVINGRRNLDIPGQVRWAKILGKSPDDLFEVEVSSNKP